jgi:hypothetical protein
MIGNVGFLEDQLSFFRAVYFIDFACEKYEYLS